MAVKGRWRDGKEGIGKTSRDGWRRMEIGDQSKVEWVFQNLKIKLDKSRMNKAIIACHSSAPLDIMAIPLKQNEIQFVRINKTVFAKQCSRGHHQFQNPQSLARILLLTSGAGGVTLNLTATNLLYMVAPDWSDAVEDQVEYRAHRIDQKQKIQICHIHANNGIDECCKSMQELKKTKEWSIRDLMEHDNAKLWEGSETQILVEETKKRLVDMEKWTKEKLMMKLDSVYRESKKGPMPLRNGSEHDNAESSSDDQLDENSLYRTSTRESKFQQRNRQEN